MRKILTPTKDTTIYQKFPDNNAGLDEILEIGKVIETNLSAIDASAYISASARSILQFTLPTTESVDVNANYYLNLRLANATDIHKNQEVLVYPISRSWDEGSGFFYQNIKNVNDGATWNRCTKTLSWSMAGGDYLTGTTSASVKLITYPLQDLRIDVTDILQPFVSQSLQNEFYGLIVTFPNSDEADADNKGNLKVFSSQTHTIHLPTLEIAWDSQIFNTGTLQPVPSTLDVKIVATNVQEKYSIGDVARINFTVRDSYPLRSFNSTLRYKNKYYLPSSSYYSITDVQANTVIVPFDEFSKIDCDVNGSHILLDTSPLYRGRFYSIKLKIVSGSFTKTVDPNIQFSIL
jgi:hypothetical protein